MKLSDKDHARLTALIMRRTKSFWCPPEWRRRRNALLIAALVFAILGFAVAALHFLITIAGLLLLPMFFMLRQNQPIGKGGESAPLFPEEIAHLRKTLTPPAFAALCEIAGTDAGGVLTLGHADKLMVQSAVERAEERRAELHRRQQQALE